MLCRQYTPLGTNFIAAEKTPAIVWQRLCHRTDRRLTVQKTTFSLAMCWNLEKFSPWDVRKLSNLKV
jgi:hypothetical protein